ncbi:IS5/IS1182 family transposase [Tamilnaduibacter salinus]|uniref:IS5/IS1182 family transposase n=2 Tax=Tamilnaduibacter salinus TaxID=1484056 RepID=A0A2A2I330_9GAMM|nr:IS5/IS1182 family transposase [Tamilnaduibacter salinus]
MRHIEGASRDQSLLLPPSIDEYVSEDHPVRVIDAFVDSLDVAELGFSKALPRQTGRRPYHPGDLLKLFIYAYLNQTRSTRRLEKECHRNLEVIWLMKQLKPDFKTIADFRKDNGHAIKRVCRQFVVFCKEAGLVSGDLVAVDGSKFKAAASKDQALTRRQLREQVEQLDRRITTYLEHLSEVESSDEPEFEHEQVTKALDYLRHHQHELREQLNELEAEGRSQHCRTEPQARLMRSGREGTVVGYNAQNAVDEQHQLIIHHELTQHGADNQLLAPMSHASQQVLGQSLKTIVADTGYSNGQHIDDTQERGVEVAVPAKRSVNNKDSGQLFQKHEFTYRPEDDTYQCPAGKTLHYKTYSSKDRAYLYTRQGCHRCPLQHRCTRSDQRWVSRHFEEHAFERSNLQATPTMMRRRQAVVEPPFGTLKRLLNQGRFSVWGLSAARAEYSLAVLSYNLIRVINVLGVRTLLAKLA